MKRFFAIVLCLVVTASAFAATPRQKRRGINPSAVVIATAVRLLEWRFGVVPASDGLRPPIPAPSDKATACCK